MPVPVVMKATFFFEMRTFGWTESFLFSQTSEDLTLTMPSVQILAQKRAALLGAEAVLKAQRLSIEMDADGKPRVGDSFLSYNAYTGDPTKPCADEDLAVLITMRNLVSAKRRNMFLRGFPDEVEAGGGKLDLTAGNWLNLLQSWTAAMLAKGIGWWSGDKSIGYPLTGYTFDPATGWTQVTLGATAFVAPFGVITQARFKGVNGQSALNGLHLVRSISGNSAWIEKPLALKDWVFGGTMYLYGRHFEQAFTINAQKIVTRRAGAPLLQSRGRRRAQVRD